MTPPSLSTVRAALSFIPSNDRDLWIKTGLAIKSEYAGDDGAQMFDEWSQSSDSYNAKAVRTAWRSFKTSGGVTIATLLHEAKTRGFDLKAHAPAAPESPDQTATRKAAQAQREKAERDAIFAKQEAAAARAAEQWQTASETGHSPYLERKGVKPYGVRFEADGTLLVPLRDGSGTLWNVQRIAPVKPTESSDKKYLPAGRKTGLWHWVGTSVDAPALLVCEGFATGASLHEATGLRVAVAFDTGNLLHVARALRMAYPHAVIAVCGDDDTETAQRTGKNPGREAAQRAAKAVGGVCPFPDALPPGGSDFNDMHAHAGLDAVRRAVQVAIDAAATPAASDALQEAPSSSQKLDRFDIDDHGVWHIEVDEDRTRRRFFVCSPLHVTAQTRDLDGNGWGYLLEWKDALCAAKQWAMPARMLSGDGAEYRATLLNMGLKIAPSPKARNLLTQYIQSRTPAEFARCVDRSGWQDGGSFVLPRKTIRPADAERIVYQTDGYAENTFRERGTLKNWQDRVASKCVGNSRLLLAVSVALAAPLLRLVGMESGGLHLRGDSSSGKTSALRVAASVYGGADYLQRWRSTENALESTAAQHSDVLLILDELAQVDSKAAGECAYLLANETGKARSTRNGLPRQRLTWRLLFLSAGEIGLADHMAESGKRARVGQELRMADVPADAGAGIGIFETLHGLDSGAALSTTLTSEAAKNFGTAGSAWLEWLVANYETARRALKTQIDRLAHAWIPEAASGQVSRVGHRFALVAAAGELATQAGITGWAEGEATAGVKKCFDSWLAARGGIGNCEVTQMLKQVRGFLEKHGSSRFTWFHRATDDHAPNTPLRAGYKRLISADGKPIKSSGDHFKAFGDRVQAVDAESSEVEYLVLQEVFRDEVCAGFDYRAVCRVLAAHDVLALGTGGRHDRRERMPWFGLGTVYVIKPSIFSVGD